mgnify:CR=1 FL=1
MIQPASNNDDTPTLMSRSDVRRIEQALRNRWELPQRLFEALPAAMMKLLVNGTARDQIAAARVLVQLNAQNTQPQERAAPVVNVGVQVNGNPQAGRTLASEIAERIRIERLSSQPAG